jgi:hypothetical protein
MPRSYARAGASYHPEQAGFAQGTILAIERSVTVFPEAMAQHSDRFLAGLPQLPQTASLSSLFFCI